MNAGSFRGGFHNNGFFTSSTAISIGDWNHVMLVLNSSTNTLKFYLNGVLDNSQSCNGFNFGGPDVDLGIGDRNESSIGPMDGKISEVRIYPRALTPAQVYQNYNATKTKYINEAPDTAPKIGPGIVTNSNLLLNYDFGNRATYDPVENRFTSSANLLKYSDGTSFGRLTDWSWLGASTPEAIPNSAIAPDGSLTAWKVSGPSLYQSIINDGDFTMSAWVKTVDGSSASVQQSVYLLGTGGDVLSTTHTATGDWQRITFSSVATSIYGNPAGKYHRYTPFASSADLYVWAPQVELKSSVGRYVPTYGTAITPPTTVKNLSSSSYPGTINGPTFNSDGYFDLDGTDDKISTNSTIANFMNITVEWWGTSDYPDSGYKSPLMKTTNTAWTDGFGFYQQSGVVSWWVNEWNGGGVTETQSSTTSFGFTHWVGTYDNSNVKLYRNGVLENTASYTTAMTNPNVSFDIGNSKDNYYWDGSIGEVRIYDTALSATEVSQNFNATKSKYGL
jgi:hypothetical protein